jgi:hypothetical protein
VCNGSRNTTIFGEISEINYMFRPLIEWVILYCFGGSAAMRLAAHSQRDLAPPPPQRYVCYMLSCAIFSIISCFNLIMAHSIRGQNMYLISKIFPNIVVLRLSLHTHFIPASDHTTGIMSLKISNVCFSFVSCVVCYLSALHEEYRNVFLIINWQIAGLCSSSL